MNGRGDPLIRKLNRLQIWRDPTLIREHLPLSGKVVDRLVDWDLAPEDALISMAVVVKGTTLENPLTLLILRNSNNHNLMEMPMVSYHKYKYVMIIVDDYMSYIWGGLLRAKNDAITYFEHWFKHQKNRFPDYVITYVRTDRGGEFTSSKFEDFLKNQGIAHQKSTAHIHQQNGRAERANQTILYKSEAMRLEASCPKSWWEFSIEMAVHLYNQTPFRRSQWKMLELEERPPKKTTAAGTAGDVLCAGDGTGWDGEADGDGGRGVDDEGL